jgi:SAM-dependent methyltransferase
MSVTTYDDVPYESRAWRGSHPSHLAAVARLAGVAAPPVDHCRVLELGCGTGGNLIPMALSLPGSRFVGVDLSQTQVLEGERLICDLALENVVLEARSILDVTDDLGAFDYIVCHGVYSWVPNAVQEAVLRLCIQHLAPTGVAFISYNTYPGWHLRGMAREMMLYHAGSFAEPAERVRQARAFLQFLADSAHRGAGHLDLLRDEVTRLQKAPDFYLFHEHLEELNRPLYFHEFAKRLSDVGLQYLAEATPTAIRPGEFRPEVEETVRALAHDPISFQQYLDFLRNRTFRETLVCRGDLPVRHTPVVEAVFGLQLSSQATPVGANPDLRSTAVEQFRMPVGPTLAASHPWVKTALVALAEPWPGTMPFEALIEQVRARLDLPAPPTPAERLDFAGALVSCWTAGFVELHAQPPRLALHAGTRPVASPLARLEAARGPILTSLAHRPVQVPELARRVLLLLDGRHDRAALVGELARTLATEGVSLTHDGVAREGAAGEPQTLDAAVEQSLVLLGRAGVLLA